MIEIIPAIDIIGGRCVRLTKGDYGTKKVYDASPAEMALRYADCGVRRIHLVDLDGAKASAPKNLSVLREIASAVSCELEWGGGIAEDADLAAVFDAGATHAIIGSVAALEPEKFARWLEMYGKRMILGADVRDGKVAVKGWTETSGTTVSSLVGRFEGLGEVICTDISRDGMLAGPSGELYAALRSEFPGISFTVSGGVSSMEDIKALDALGLAKAIVGKAIYEGHITLEEIAQWSQNG